MLYKKEMHTYLGKFNNLILFFINVFFHFLSINVAQCMTSIKTNAQLGEFSPRCNAMQHSPPPLPPNW